MEILTSGISEGFRQDLRQFAYDLNKKLKVPKKVLRHFELFVYTVWQSYTDRLIFQIYLKLQS